MSEATVVPDGVLDALIARAVSVTTLAVALAEHLELAPDRVDGITVSAFLHDIGMLAVPHRIVMNEDALTGNDHVALRSHSLSGHDMVKDLSFPWPVARAIAEHHERLDGSGYPRHIGNDEICLEARIIAVADTVDAMCADQPYRDALGLDTALTEIEQNSGRLYDPDVVSACLSLFLEEHFVLAPNPVLHSTAAELVSRVVKRIH